MSLGRTCCWMRRATGDQELVADRVAEAVVDQLEAVEVEEHQAELARRLGLRAGERLRQVVLEAAPVRQPGQAVVEGDVLQPGLGLRAAR